MKPTMLAMMVAAGLVGCGTSNPMPGLEMTQAIDEQGLTHLELTLDRPATRHQVLAVKAGDATVARVPFAPGEQRHVVVLATEGDTYFGVACDGTPGPVPPGPDPGP